MADRTAAWLKANYEEHPRAEWQGDLIDSISNIADEGTGRCLFVSKKGNDTSGDGTILRPYLTFAKAFTQTTTNKPEVIVFPGTYQENVSWPARTNIHLIGVGKQGAVLLSDASAGGTAVLTVYPATQLASFSGFIDNVTFSHNGTGLYMDNSSCQGTFTLKLTNCGFMRTGGTSVITNHGTNNPILLDVRNTEIDGKVFVDLMDTNDRAVFYHSILTGGLASNTDDIAGTAEITFASCEIKHEGVSGGSACQLVNSLFSWSRTGQTLAKVDTSDLAGSHSENIVGA